MGVTSGYLSLGQKDQNITEKRLVSHEQQNNLPSFYFTQISYIIQDGKRLNEGEEHVHGMRFF